MKEKWRVTSVLFNVVTVIMLLAASYLVLVFPADFVLDLFWEKCDQGVLLRTTYDYGQFAGLPAGEGILKLSNIEEYNSAEGSEYFTFRTEKIIPLEAYRLKSSSDATDTKYRRGKRVVSSGVEQWNTYGKKAGFKRYLFNRYYLVQLPDGNYAAAFLDDGSYLRYRLTGQVQLPVGRVTYMTANEKKLLAPYITAYGLHEEKLLDMFCEERYENHKTLNYMVLSAVWILVLGVYIMFVLLIEKVFGKKALD
ncbi:MAG: hypothetical protein K2O40_10280 [Lachnospiraceae bacterium]|nr:hypothetical protein [Lachnospiraceae bacterium]